MIQRALCVRKYSHIMFGKFLMMMWSVNKHLWRAITLNVQDNLSNADSSYFPFIITAIIKTLTITLLLSSLSVIVYSEHNVRNAM